MPPSSSSEKPSSAFEAFSEGVKRWIWQQGWQALRPVQEQAASPILDGTKDVIISAPTAGGKTEAAFLPIISKINASARTKFGCLCISPLKALINDQFRRLEDICQVAQIPVHRWHGDVTTSRKAKFINEPAGVLLITPESLEALFVLHGSQIPKIFEAVNYIVIDELHSFIGTERGRQLQSLLHRIELAIRRRAPRAALSATIGDMQIAAEFLRPGKGSDVEIINADDASQEIKLQVRGYVWSAPTLEDYDPALESEDHATGDVYEICLHLFRVLRGEDNLIFANSRSKVEELADILRRYSEKERVPNEFYPHHGSLSKEIREEAEAKLKDRNFPASVICTSTLEMGIDVGDMASIAQIGTPPSVASMKQRLGRSGRRAGKPAVMRIYITENEITPQTSIQDALRAELVQAAAMVKLLLGNWIESPLDDEIDFSTLLQQLLSLIAQHGGVTAEEAWNTLCRMGPFREVDSSLFTRFLKAAGAKEMIQQMHDGVLVLGIRGERIVNHYSFYAAFHTPEEYRMVAGNKLLGTMPVTTVVVKGMFLIFAGKRWKVTSVDSEAKTIHLEPSPGGRVPKFIGSGALVHDRVREEMFSVYNSTEIMAFLDTKAKALLSEARDNFHQFDLGNRALLQSGDDTLIFPWTGDRVLNTLQLQLLQFGIVTANEGIALQATNASLTDVRSTLKEIQKLGPVEPLALSQLAERLVLRKYDHLFDDDLLRIDYASRALDCEGAWKAVNQILTKVG